MPYPARLTFELADEAHAAAVLDAARELQLPFEVNGPQRQIVVVVDAPMTAYRFGGRTQELLTRTAGKDREQR